MRPSVMGSSATRRVGSKEAMLANCARFIERRCEGGGWSSYEEIETELKQLRDALAPLHRHSRGCSQTPNKYKACALYLGAAEADALAVACLGNGPDKPSAR